MLSTMKPTWEALELGMKSHTSPKFSIEPENDGLEDDFPKFQG